MTGRMAYRCWIGVLFALMGLGFAAWVYQLSEGLTVTGMNNVNSWGLYIIAFMYFVGLSAGGLIVVAARALKALEQQGAIRMQRGRIIIVDAQLLASLSRSGRGPS